MKKIILFIFASLLLFSGCSSDKNESSETSAGTEDPNAYYKITSGTVSDADIAPDTLYGQIEMMDGSIIVFELYPNIAPITVKNFVNLVNSGYYSGKNFHRNNTNQFVQGGSLNGDGTGVMPFNIIGEFTQNGIENNLKHGEGTLSMARTTNANTASAQFFITVTDMPGFDGRYATFGKVIEGLSHVKGYARLTTYSNEIIVKKPVIKSIVMLESYSPS